MIKIEVTNARARRIAYTDKAGKPAAFYLQEVYAFIHDRDGNPAPYPEKVEIALDRDDHGEPITHPVGVYTLHPSALYVDAKGRLAVAPRLAPVKRTA